MSFQFVSELTGKPHDMDIPLNVEFFFIDFLPGSYTTKSSPFIVHGDVDSITIRSLCRCCLSSPMLLYQVR